jgi:hypothetical protein
MSESSNRKQMLMALAGVGIFVGAALVFHYLSGEDGESDDIKSGLKQAGLDEVKRDPTGQIDIQWLIKVLSFAGKANK